jgi:dihydrofolate reductase
VRISIIVALADNGVIGRAQQLPWHLPDDLRRFKALTLGKPMLMGRRTFESIGRALPGRANLVLSRAPLAAAAAIAAASSGAAALPPATTLERVASVDEALRRCAGAEELCVIGGADVFRALLPQATDLHLTRVHAEITGDVYFPAIDDGEWREVARSEHAADERHAWPMSFIDLVRP